MIKETPARTLSLAKYGIKNYYTKRPLSISFEITHSCNAKCKHCHLGGHVEEDRATPQTYGKICRELRPVVAQASGGEPLLRRDLEQIIEAIRIPNRAPYITLTTNAALLSKQRYESLCQAGVDEFSVSLDYPDERHDEFRGIPGLFNKISNLVHEIGSKKDKITFCCVIQRDNFRSLLQVAELAARWNVRINFSAYTYLRTHKKNMMIPAEELEELEEIIDQILVVKKKYKNIRNSAYVLRKTIEFFRNGNIPKCGTGGKFINVNPDGTFSPCGLIITNYKSKEELFGKFSKNNNCKYCYTSIRANCEKSMKQLIVDSIRSY